MDPGVIFDLLKQSVSRLFVGDDSVLEEVQRLEDNLRSIRQLLDFAEQRQVNDYALKLWSDKLKGLSEEMKDVLDQWNTAKLKSAIDKEWQPSPYPLVKEWQKPKCACFRFWEKPNKKSPSHSISHKIKGLSLKLDELLKYKPAFGFDLNATKELIERPLTTSFIDVSDVVGRGETVDNLVRNLLDMEGIIPCVISLVGMAGIGKSTVAQLAYNNDEVQDHFNIRVWVCVSQPFDMVRVAKGIVQSIVCLPTYPVEFGILLQQINDLVKGKKFLLVLDDVWNEDSGKWEPFRVALKSGAQGSKILVTTRNERVAHLMGSAIVIKLKLLTDDDCWLVLSRRAFYDKDSEQLQELEDIARKIAMKCKGLPLYAKVLGSLMRSKSTEEWQYLLLSNLWDLEGVNMALFAPLLLQYYDFPSTVRDCLSYCAVFPKDKLILTKDLIQLWMAQDYLKENGNMEIIGQRYFEILAMHSFFQDFEKDEDDGTIIGCKMHDVVHDFVVSQTRNEEFFQMVVDSNESEIAPLHSTRHLSLTFTRQAQFPEFVYHAKELRTLLSLNSRHAGINAVLPNLCQHLTCLRALNLSDSSIEKVPNEIKNLEYLRFLDLSSNYKIEELPEMLCNLCNLQTLNVSRCYMLEKLPKGMGKLINLRHLVLEGTNFMKMFPKEIGRLSSLRTLTKFIRSGDDESEGCGLEELGNMYHLEGALEINGLGNVVDVDEAKNAQLKKKNRLCCLYLGFDGEGEENRRRESDEYILNALEPGPDVRVLQIHLYQATTMFPNWLMSLNMLEVLKLTKCSNLQHLPPLSRFRFLKSLEILNAHSLKKVGVEFLGIEYINKDEKVHFFPNLISLIFSGLKELEEWDGIGGMGEGEGVSIMPCLQILIIRDCPKLKALPDFLKEIPIKELRIEYCSQISNWEMLSTNIKNLKVLVLKQCEKLEHFPPFGKLRVLESLSLWNVGSVKSVGPEFLGIESDSKDSFPNLNFLEFCSFGEWEEWVGIGGKAEEDKSVEVMPCLRTLIIYNCPKLKSLPHFLQNSPLEEMRISGSPILKQTCQGGDWPKSSHIPNIKIND